MNKDLSIITDQTFQWEIFFNRDLSKQAQETSTIQREASTGSFNRKLQAHGKLQQFSMHLWLSTDITSKINITERWQRVWTHILPKIDESKKGLSIIRKLRCPHVRSSLLKPSKFV